MKLLSPSRINDLPHLESRERYSVMDGSGLFVVVEKKGNECKRFVGYTRHPSGRKGKTVEVKLGVWGKDVKNQRRSSKDLSSLVRT